MYNTPWMLGTMPMDAQNDPPPMMMNAPMASPQQSYPQQVLPSPPKSSPPLPSPPLLFPSAPFSDSRQHTRVLTLCTLVFRRKRRTPLWPLETNPKP